MNKGNTVKAIIAVVVLLAAVLIFLKYGTSVLESKPEGAIGSDPNKYTPGQKPKVD